MSLTLYKSNILNSATIGYPIIVGISAYLEYIHDFEKSKKYKKSIKNSMITFITSFVLTRFISSKKLGTIPFTIFICSALTFYGFGAVFVNAESFIINKFFPNSRIADHMNNIFYYTLVTGLITGIFIGIRLCKVFV